MASAASVSFPAHSCSGKDNISAGILHKFSFQCRTRNRRQEEGWECRGMRLPNVCSILNFWAPFEFCGLLGFRLPLPNSFDQKLKLYFGAAPRGQRRQRPRGDGDMFSATATTTKAFSHKGPPIRGRHRRRTRRLSEHSMSAKCTCSSPRML